MSHDESHNSHRNGILRAMVLGANDGIVSTACLVLGVAASSASHSAIITAGTAGLVAGSAAMAVGEYVSVSSQRDTERADIARETWELENEAEKEFAELAGIYEAKGLSHDLAVQVAAELTKNDALKAHLAEELGITEHNTAKPLEAAVSSAVAFASGAIVPLAAMALAPHSSRFAITIALVVVALVALGYGGAHFGGAKKTRPIFRVLIGGLAAMAVTIAIGHLFGTSVS